MKTHKIRWMHLDDATITTYCGRKVKVTDDNYKKYVGGSQDCNCARCNKKFEEELAEHDRLLEQLDNISKYGA